MMHDQIREARIRAGLTQVKLAKLAGVPRSQLRKFEEGGNITLSTLRKIVAQLPELHSLSLGAVKIASGGIDPIAVRTAAMELIEAAQRLLTALGAPADDITAPRDQGPVGATRYEPEMRISPELEQRLKKMEAEIHRSDRRREQ